MKYFNLATLAVSCALLTACETTATKEGEVDSQTLQPTAPEAAPVTALPKVSDNSPSDISRLQAQITALQEQTIKVTSDTGAILKMTQLLLADKQTREIKAEGSAESIPVTQGNRVADTSNLEQLMRKMDELAMSPNGAYGLVSSYTASRQWILIRFDRNTGETWLADSNGWNALRETDELPISQYDIHLVRGDQDQKGYVAARIDQRTGDTWWLNQRQWLKYE